MYIVIKRILLGLKHTSFFQNYGIENNGTKKLKVPGLITTKTETNTQAQAAYIFNSPSV